MKKRTITYIIVILIMLVIAIGVFITRKHKEDAEELKTISQRSNTISILCTAIYSNKQWIFQRKGIKYRINNRSRCRRCYDSSFKQSI